MFKITYNLSQNQALMTFILIQKLIATKIYSKFIHFIEIELV